MIPLEVVSNLLVESQKKNQQTVIYLHINKSNALMGIFGLFPATAASQFLALRFLHISTAACLNISKQL